jgi:4a-hydroxytetrahydrobiopterin dehydratase
MATLANKRCVPCDGGTPRLKGKALKKIAAQLRGGWKLKKSQRIEKEFKFKNFLQALKFTNAIGKIAERQNHHPDIQLSWGLVKVEIWTHKVNGLTESDFVLAARIDRAPGAS